MARDIMNDESKNVICEKHGTNAAATYVCSHLATNPVQRWNSDRPSQANPWPDAWCNQCNARFQVIASACAYQQRGFDATG
jgi:hypothetical protein